MKIALASPFNPYSVREYFDSNVDLPNINITATSVNTYVKGLLQLGHDVIVFTTSPIKKKYKLLYGKHIKIYIISNKFLLPGFGRYKTGFRIQKYIKTELNNIDILHAEWTYEFAFATMKFAKELPIFCSVRDWCPYILSIAQNHKDRYYWQLSYFIFRKVMKEKRFCFIANSQYTFEKIKNEYPNNNVKIIFNPIDSRFILDERSSYPEDLTLVSISQSLTDSRKNYEKLLKAFQIYLHKDSTAKLILIGSYSEEWKKRMDNSGLLKGVSLKGEMQHDDIFSVLDNSTCLIHPALEETFGNILLEAMSRRVPCIGGEKSGAVPQVLGYGKYGILCDVENEESIAESIAKVKNIENIKSIVEGSSRFLCANYCETIIAQQHIGLYQQLLNEFHKFAEE